MSIPAAKMQKVLQTPGMKEVILTPSTEDNSDHSISGLNNHDSIPQILQ